MLAVQEKHPQAHTVSISHVHSFCMLCGRLLAALLTPNIVHMIFELALYAICYVPLYDAPYRSTMGLYDEGAHYEHRITNMHEYRPISTL